LDDLRPLVCIECGAARAAEEDPAGRQAHRADLEEVVVYCPACAEREFGN
jgi:hypothetical protein